MRPYRPTKPRNVLFAIEVPVVSMVKGVEVKEFSDSGTIFGSYVTFGGTERVVNDVLVVDDTATVECYFDPRITAACRLRNTASGTRYDIIGAPEDIECRGQYMRIRVQAIRGGV